MKKAQVKVNENPLSAFKAKLVGYKVSACSYDNGYFLPIKSIIPVKLKGNVGLRKITMTLDFEGESEGKIALAISNFTAIVKNKAEIILPDGFYYCCMYETSSTPEEKAPWIKRVEFEFYGYRHGPLETVTITDGMTVVIKGNFETPVRYTVVPVGANSFSVNGIAVKNVTSTVTIDGMNSKVTMYGLNKFGDTNIVEFPKMPVGENLMSVTGDVTVTMEYYPIYL